MIVAQAVTKRFGGVTALDSLDLEIRAGCAVTLLGRNGSGKSTCLDLLTGRVRPTSGSILLDGSPVPAGRPWWVWQRGLARTFQRMRPAPGVTCLDHVVQGLLFTVLSRPRFVLRALLLSGLERQDLDRLRDTAALALDRVGLAAKARADAASLTQEESRLLELARALAPRPRLLLLDEPASGLHRAAVTRLSDLLAELAEGGVTLLMAEHVLELATRVTSRVVLLSSGRKRFAGTWQELQENQPLLADYMGNQEHARD